MARGLHVGSRLPEAWRAALDGEDLADWRPETFDLGDGATEVVVMGQGPTLLLLPPLPGYKEAFVRVAARLARHFRVVTYDLRARFPARPTWDLLLRDLEGVADAFAPGSSLVLGHSLGGALAQRWSLARPERVSGLILSSSFARVSTPPGQVWKRFFEQPFVVGTQRWLPERMAGPMAIRFAARGAWVFDPRCDERVLAFVRLGIRDLPIAQAWTCVRLALEHDVRSELVSLRLPVLLLVGERETAFGRATTAELERLLPHAERRELPGVSHLHPLSAPECLEREVTEWARGRLMDSSS